MINTNTAKVMLVMSRQNSLIYHSSSMPLIYNYQVMKRIGEYMLKKTYLRMVVLQHISKKIAPSVLLLSQINSLLSDDDKLLFYKKVSGHD